MNAINDRYNVFISYKATDGGKPTADALIAEELYRTLSSFEGIFPFWDRKELVNMDGCSDFGTSIYSALETSRVFIFICTNAEYLRTNYVESEWSTYLGELNSGRKPKGSIFGITANIDEEELPLALRKFETLPYSEENIRFIAAFVRNRIRELKPEADCQLSSWQQVRREELLNRLVFSDMNARQFVDDFLTQSKKMVACLSLSDSYNNDTFLAAEAVRLNPDYDIYYFYSLEEAIQLLQKVSLGSHLLSGEKEKLLFIDAPLTSKDVVSFKQLLKSVPCRMIVLSRGQIPALCNEQVYWTRLFPSDEHELTTIIKALCREKEIESAEILIDKLLLPANKCLRQPTYVVHMIEYLSISGSEQLRSPGMTLLEILDSSLAEKDTSVPEKMEEIVQSFCQKKTNSFLLKKNTANLKLVECLKWSGLAVFRRGVLSFTLKQYLEYKTAEYAIFRYGQDSVKVLAEEGMHSCLPICEYILSEKYGQFLTDVSADDLTDDQKLELITLFLDSDSFAKVADYIHDEEFVAGALTKYVNEGYYSVIRNALKLLKKNHPEISEKSWVKVLEMMLNYQLDGSYVDCDCSELLAYWVYKGIIEYYRDEYAQAILAFERALTFPCDQEKLCKILLVFSDVLVDSGSVVRLQELLTEYQDIFTHMSDFVHYYIYRGNISLDQLEPLDARDYYMEAFRMLQSHFNAALLSRVYGNLGLVEFYMGRMAQARRYYLKNEDLSIDSDNANGIAISRIYLGETYLHENDYQTAFMYFSAAMFYAQKAQNYWRIHQIHMICDQFYPGFPQRVEEHIRNIQSIHSSRYHSTMFLLLAECMLRTGCKSKEIQRVLELSIKGAGTESRLDMEIATLYLNLLQNQESHENAPYLDAYFAWSRKLYADYLSGKIASIELPKARLPFVYYRELESEHLRFCHFSKEYAVDLFNYASRIQPTKYVLWERHESVFASTTYIEEMVRMEPKDDDYLLWAIMEKNSSTVIGSVDLRYEEDYEGVEIGIILSDFYWRKHYATETIHCICEYARSVLGLSEIFGVCVNGNRASEQMLRKNGFNFVRCIENYHNISFLPDKTGLMFRKSLI